MVTPDKFCHDPTIFIMCFYVSVIVDCVNGKVLVDPFVTSRLFSRIFRNISFNKREPTVNSLSTVTVDWEFGIFGLHLSIEYN